MKNSKYIGGSKIVSYRLPLHSLSTVNSEIKAILDRYAQIDHNKAQLDSIPLCSSAKTVLSIEDKVEPITYVCGCTVIDSLFRRQAGCSKAKVQH